MKFKGKKKTTAVQSNLFHVFHLFFIFPSWIMIHGSESISWLRQAQMIHWQMFPNICIFIKINIYRSQHMSEECIVSWPIRNPVLAQLIAFHTIISGLLSTKCCRADELGDELGWWCRFTESGIWKNVSVTTWWECSISVSAPMLGIETTLVITMTRSQDGW